jgi:plastocyanin
MQIRTTIFTVATCITIALTIVVLSIIPFNIVFAIAENSITQQQQQPNLKASDIYQTHTMSLGKDIKNLVIVIPDEGHEDPNQSPKDLRIVNQPYLPQNAIVNVGAIVTWLNADVDHPHSISLVDNNSKSVVYESGIIKNYTASRPIMFNNTGTFTYSGPSFDKGVPSYKMNGTLTVVNQPLTTSFNTTTASRSSPTVTTTATKNMDTISTLMVPSNLLDKAVSEIKGQGFGIDNQYPFMSLRGGGSTAGGDKNQVLLVLTSSGKNLNEVISALSNISSTIPYR